MESSLEPRRRFGRWVFSSSSEGSPASCLLPTGPCVVWAAFFRVVPDFLVAVLAAFVDSPPFCGSCAPRTLDRRKWSKRNCVSCSLMLSKRGSNAKALGSSSGESIQGDQQVPLAEFSTLNDLDGERGDASSLSPMSWFLDLMSGKPCVDDCRCLLVEGRLIEFILFSDPGTIKGFLVGLISLSFENGMSEGGNSVGVLPVTTVLFSFSVAFTGSAV